MFLTHKGDSVVRMKASEVTWASFITTDFSGVREIRTTAGLCWDTATSNSKVVRWSTASMRMLYAPGFSPLASKYPNWLVLSSAVPGNTNTSALAMGLPETASTTVPWMRPAKEACACALSVVPIAVATTIARKYP